MALRDLGLLIVAACLAAGLTLVVRRLALARQIGLSQPRERDVHSRPIPRLGGVAVTVAFLIVTGFVVAVAPKSLLFGSDTWWHIDRNLMGIWLGVVILLAIGIYDDIRGLLPWIKLLGHAAAGAILAVSGVLISHVSNPFGNQFELGVWTPLLVVGFVVLMINAINWIDGLDGLASGVSLIATVILYFLAIRPDVHQPAMSVLAVVLSGALIGFLPFNFFPASIFLGDSGSQVLGFLLAAMAIISGGKVATAVLILGVPLMDTVWVVVRRLVTGQPVYKADKLHIHHRMLAAGLTQRQAVLTLYGFAAVFGIIALNTRSLGKFVAGVLLISLMLVGGTLITWLPKHRKSHG